MTDLMVISHACFMGINRSVYRLFKTSGWNIEIIAPRTLKFPNGIREAEPARESDPPIHFLELKGSNPRTYSFDGLETVMNTKQPSLVLLDNDPVSFIALKVGKWCQNNKSKLYCISCENMPLDMRSAFKRRGWRGLPSAIVKRILLWQTKKIVEGVFSINRDGQLILKKEGFKNVVHMPLGFDPEYFYPDAFKGEEIRNKLGLTKPVIAYFGRLTKEKGIHVLIKALSGMKDQAWHLLMDDFDEYASDYTKEIHDLLEESGIRDRVVFISPSHYEMGGYMNASDIVVVPSVSTYQWKEQYGRVVAEALACSKKVVVSDSGSLKEVLNDYGYIFPEGHSESLCKVIKKLLHLPKMDNKRILALSEFAIKELSILKQKKVMQSAFNR